MFIKLPSGRIIQIEKIISVVWDNFSDVKELFVYTPEDKEPFILGDKDAERLYQYLESICIE